MAEKQNTPASCASQCSALVNFLREFGALDISYAHLNRREYFEDEKEQQVHDQSRREANSKILWPFYNRLLRNGQYLLRSCSKRQ